MAARSEGRREGAGELEWWDGEWLEADDGGLYPPPAEPPEQPALALEDDEEEC